MSRKTVYAIASGKGGVGKTTTTVNVGTALAGAGNTVAVVDADLGMANLAGLVSLSPDATTLHEVLAGEASVEAATYELADGIVAVPSGADLETYADVDATGLRDVVARLRGEFDYVLLDVGAGVSHESVLPLGLADEVVLVTTPEPASVQDASKTADLTERAEGSVAGLVITRVRDDRNFDFEGIAGRVGVPLLGTVPEDDAVRDSVYSGTPVVVDAPESPAAVAYRRIAKRLVGDAAGDATGDAASSETTGSGEAAQSAETEGPDSTDRSNDVSSAVSGIEGDDEGNGRRDGSAAVRDTPTGEVTGDAESSNAESEAETETETPSEAEASGGAEAGAGADADPVEPSGADDGTGSGTEADAVSAGDAGEESDPDTAAEPETDAAETGGEPGGSSAAPPASEEGVTIPDAEGPSDDDDTEGVTISEAEATQGEEDDINEDAIPFSDHESTPPSVGEDDEDDEDDDGGFFGRLLG
jgi:septum site-determining protein MinD